MSRFPGQLVFLLPCGTGDQPCWLAKTYCLLLIINRLDNRLVVVADACTCFVRPCDFIDEQMLAV